VTEISECEFEFYTLELAGVRSFVYLSWSTAVWGLFGSAALWRVFCGHAHFFGLTDEILNAHIFRTEREIEVKF